MHIRNKNYVLRVLGFSQNFDMLLYRVKKWFSDNYKPSGHKRSKIQGLKWPKITLIALYSKYDISNQI